jgi:hypothetical protein
MGRWIAIAIGLVACSHRSEAPKASEAPAPAPSGEAGAPAAKRGVMGYQLAKGQVLLGVGGLDAYVAQSERGATDVPLVRTADNHHETIGTSVHGFAMTDDDVYWTDPGYDGPNTGGVWRARRPDGDPEPLVRGSNLPEKLVVMGGTPSQLAVLDSIAFAMVADDGAVYWVGGKDAGDHRLGEVTSAGAATTLATLDGEAHALATDGTQLFVGIESPKGVKVVSIAKRGGPMTTWAEGAFDDRTLAVMGGAVYLLDQDARAVEKIASPGAAPEIVFHVPAGEVASGVVATSARVYVGVRPDH